MCILFFSMSLTATSDCNSFFRTDWSDQILTSPLSVNIAVGTGARSYDKSLRVYMSHELALNQ